MYLGSQRVARAVVSWFATVKGEEDLPAKEEEVLSREVKEREVEGLEEAVVKGSLIVCLLGRERMEQQLISTTDSV